MRCPIENSLNWYFSDQMEKERKENYLIEEAHNLRIEAYKALSSIIYPKFTKEFATILAYAKSEGLAEADKIINFMGLESKHFLAIDDDLKGLEEVINREAEDYL